MERIICYYHSSDLDGHCSGAIVKEKFPSALCFGINYGYTFHWDKVNSNDIIYMVDFSLPIEDMIRLAGLVKELIWIDHHVTAIRAAKEAGFGKLFNVTQVTEIGRAGCELTWEHLFPVMKMPNGVRLLGRYDVWDHSDPNTLPYQYGLRISDTRPHVSMEAIWEPIFSDLDYFFKKTISAGEAIVKYNNHSNEIYCRSHAYETTFEGHKCIVANRGVTNSSLFDSIFDPEKHDFALVYSFCNKGIWLISLYSGNNPRVDVSQIAKKYGGGGHKGAAGFNVKELPKELLVIEDIIKITSEE